MASEQAVEVTQADPKVTYPHLDDIDISWLDIAVTRPGNELIVAHAPGWAEFNLDLPYLCDNVDDFDAPTEPGVYRWSGYTVGSWGEDDPIVLIGGIWEPYRLATPPSPAPEQALALVREMVRDRDAIEQVSVEDFIERVNGWLEKADAIVATEQPAASDTSRGEGVEVSQQVRELAAYIVQRQNDYGEGRFFAPGYSDRVLQGRADTHWLVQALAQFAAAALTPPPAEPIPSAQGEGVKPSDVFEMGFDFAFALRGQALEDSRAVGRLLGRDTLRPIAARIDAIIKRDGFGSFQDSDSGIAQCRQIINEALDAALATTPYRERAEKAEALLAEEMTQTDREARVRQLLGYEAGYEISRWDAEQDCSVMAKHAVAVAIRYADDATVSHRERADRAEARVADLTTECEALREMVVRKNKRVSQSEARERGLRAALERIKVGDFKDANGRGSRGEWFAMLCEAQGIARAALASHQGEA